MEVSGQLPVRGEASTLAPGSLFSASSGIIPTLAELIALRRAALRGRDPRRGRQGVVGRAASAQRGRGMEYAESREYVAGDDARHIDWKLSARTGFTHTKTFQSERERFTCAARGRDNGKVRLQSFACKIIANGARFTSS